MGRPEAQLCSKVRRKGRDARLGHLAGLDQLSDPTPVGLGPVAARSALAEPSDVLFVVDALDLPVDPSVAERFLHCRLVVERTLAGALLETDQPDLSLGSMVAGQPNAPGLAGRDQKSLADVQWFPPVLGVDFGRRRSS